MPNWKHSSCMSRLSLPQRKLLTTCLNVSFSSKKKVLPKVSLNWILQSLLESCFIMNSITNFLCSNVRRDILNSVENRLTFLSSICVWSWGIICIYLVPNKRLNAVFSTGKGPILLGSISTELFKIIGG